MASTCRILISCFMLVEHTMANHPATKIMGNAFVPAAPAARPMQPGTTNPGVQPLGNVPAMSRGAEARTTLGNPGLLVNTEQDFARLEDKNFMAKTELQQLLSQVERTDALQNQNQDGPGAVKNSLLADLRFWVSFAGAAAAGAIFYYIIGKVRNRHDGSTMTSASFLGGAELQFAGAGDVAFGRGSSLPMMDAAVTAHASPIAAAALSRSSGPQMKGFGTAAKPAKAVREKVKPWKVTPDTGLEAAFSKLEQNGRFIENFLNPALLEDPATLRDAGERLRAGQVVILRDAFRPEFAEAAYRELSALSAPWSLNEEWFDNGYAYRHHNVYDHEKWTARLKDIFAVFQDEATKAWVAALTGRDCSGECTGAPSYYQPGDHSLPHTDWAGQRTVAYVWHLSKDWRPEYGGALYWARNPHDHATYHASFNTLCLFTVTTTSAHFVTTVSPKAKGKRLAFNGWWQSDWVPRSDDDFDARLATPEQRAGVTHTQLQAIMDMISDPFQNLAPEKRERLGELKAQVLKEFYPWGVPGAKVDRGVRG